MKATISALQFTILAAAKIVAGQLVSATNKPATPGDTVLGLAISDAEEGDSVTVLACGLADIIAGGAIQAGDRLTTDSAGKPIVTTTNDSFGLALTSASVGQTVTVLIR